MDAPGVTGHVPSAPPIKDADESSPAPAPPAADTPPPTVPVRPADATALAAHTAQAPAVPAAPRAGPPDAVITVRKSPTAPSLPPTDTSKAAAPPLVPAVPLTAARRVPAAPLTTALRVRTTDTGALAGAASVASRELSPAPPKAPTGAFAPAPTSVLAVAAPVWADGQPSHAQGELKRKRETNDREGTASKRQHKVQAVPHTATSSAAVRPATPDADVWAGVVKTELGGMQRGSDSEPMQVDGKPHLTVWIKVPDFSSR
ncbi:hypothetical protein FA95DRAFT_1614407 [Auriscalpium vulgare]|uniref:Uncharacterized protein n=1 Tax=Auriscalpium vulgare TaxID=40419 RepID=A0ACB8R161_9AGAM|nr:hypothetical protein FA95DRAFT_1614407 [Auriscalpium vulgare]